MSLLVSLTYPTWDAFIWAFGVQNSDEVLENFSAISDVSDLRIRNPGLISALWSWLRKAADLDPTMIRLACGWCGIYHCRVAMKVTSCDVEQIIPHAIPTKAARETQIVARGHLVTMKCIQIIKLSTWRKAKQNFLLTSSELPQEICHHTRLCQCQVVNFQKLFSTKSLALYSFKKHARGQGSTCNVPVLTETLGNVFVPEESFQKWYSSCFWCISHGCLRGAVVTPVSTLCLYIQYACPMHSLSRF